MNEKLVFLGYPFSIPAIRNAVEAALKGYAELKCADMELTDLHLLDKIEDMILAADLRLFDVTSHNVNVAVEFGIARALRLAPIILWCGDERYAAVNNERDVFSDLRGIDSLRYKSFGELEEELRKRIPALLAQARKRPQASAPRLQVRLEAKPDKNQERWLTGYIFNAGAAPANRVKVALAGYMLHSSVPSPLPIRIGTLVPGESPRELAFRLERFGMVEYATGMEHVLVEFTDDSGSRYEQRGLSLATAYADGTYSFTFEGLGPLKPIDKFSLPMVGLENP